MPSSSEFPSRLALPAVDLRERINLKGKQRASTTRRSRRPKPKVTPPLTPLPTEDSEVGPIHRKIPQKRPAPPDDEGQVPPRLKRVKPITEADSSVPLDLVASNAGTTAEGTMAGGGDYFLLFLVTIYLTNTQSREMIPRRRKSRTISVSDIFVAL